MGLKALRETGEREIGWRMGCVITIDGPAGSGKTSVSRMLAERLGYAYLDTGAMYRAVALAAKRGGLDGTDTPELRDLCANLDIRLIPDGGTSVICLGQEDISSLIRTPEMDMLSSKVSAVRVVREAMTTLQRKMADRHEGLVAEGRDMGTVVFPCAEAKFFLTASMAVRAERRYRERVERGERSSITRVAEQMEKRDEQDRSRSAAPLRAAPDAIVIDSTAIDLEGVLGLILHHLREGGILYGFSKINS